MKTAVLFALSALPLAPCLAQVVVPPVPKMLDAFVVVNVVTVPEGADVFLAGVHYGTSPTRVVYSAENFAKLKVEGGCAVETAQLAIRWPTGAVGAFPELRMCQGAASDYLLTGHRPASAPHADRDELFGAQRAKDRAAEAHYLAQPVPKTSAPATVRLTVHSDPQGAHIVAHRANHYYSQAPADVVMPFHGVGLRPGICSEGNVVEARWPSGAVSKPAYVHMCNGPHADYQVTITRPEGAPDADYDQKHAASLAPPPRREYRLAQVMQPGPSQPLAQAQLQPPSPPPAQAAAAPRPAPAPAPVAQAPAPTPQPQPQPAAQAALAATPRQQAVPLRQPLTTAGSVTLVLTTLPEGAEIFQKGVSMGRSPISLPYNPVAIREQVRSKGCAEVATLEARWPSGAVQVATGLSLCQGGDNDYGWTFVRPGDAPGLAVDQNFAAQLALQRMQADQANLQAQRQAQLAQQQADAQARARAEAEAQEGSEALLKGLLSLIPQAQPEPARPSFRQPLRCVTKNRFGRLETECE